MEIYAIFFTSVVVENHRTSFPLVPFRFTSMLLAHIYIQLWVSLCGCVVHFTTGQFISPGVFRAAMVRHVCVCVWVPFCVTMKTENRRKIRLGDVSVSE